jgi:general stress protein YciG
MATTSKQGNKGKGTSTRGFASMDPERQRAIASEGGKAAHERGTAHEFTSEEARRAGSMSHGNRQSAAAAKQKTDTAAEPSINKQSGMGNKSG